MTEQPTPIVKRFEQFLLVASYDDAQAVARRLNGAARKRLGVALLYDSPAEAMKAQEEYVPGVGIPPGSRIIKATFEIVGQTD